MKEYIKIYNTNITASNPPEYDLLLCLLKTLNPNEKETDIVKAIKKLGIYDVPATTSKGTERKAVDSANVGDANNI